MGYFGTQESLPELIPLKAGAMTCQYERGNLRYIRVGEEEVLRLIYTALRDDSWNTIPISITDENIVQEEDAFRITYTARYEQKHIAYRANIEIVGTSSGKISFAMKGQSLSKFKRNRVGICVLHPIAPTTGQPAEMTRPDGTRYSGTFPTQVEPHQPFLEISRMKWRTAGGIEAVLSFEGEIFEMEDQRNWTDHSFKTYGTPLRVPMPVEVKEGDTLFQKVELSVVSAPAEPQPFPSFEPVLSELGEKALFPRVGYGHSLGELSDADVELLREVPFHQLRVELDLASPEWEATFQGALKQAARLRTKLELALRFGDHPWQEVVGIVGAFTAFTDRIGSLQLMDAPGKGSVDGFLQVAEVIRKYLPGMPIGYATPGFFADLNRNRPEAGLYDFVSYSLNPQVHATDIRTIIENTAGQQYAIQTIQSFATPPPKIHISPLTFRIRGQENSHDPRLHSDLGAAFTLLSLRYLAGVDRITLYQTHGPNGIIPDAASRETQSISPIYSYLKLIKEFDPTHILLTHSPSPLEWDALGLINGRGERLYLLINFSSQALTVRLAADEKSYTIPAEGILPIRLGA